MKFPFPLPTRYAETDQRMSGGQGYVHLCKDLYLSRLVAIKVMKAKADTQNLKREVRALCDIRSRHVAQIYDLISSRGGTVALVQEYVPGQTLDSYASSAEFSSAEYLKILYQIACGLADIHDTGKVHRDIKPENLKFDAENVMKILDFGFTSDLHMRDETTKLRGTDGFLAPEFFATPPIRISPAVDTYAFGATAWCLANKGKLPQCMTEEPPQSTKAAPSFSRSASPPPQEIVTLLDATLSPSPDKRPRMRAVANTIERRLLFGRHRALIRQGQGTFDLHEPGKSVRLRSGTDAISINYDGLTFRVHNIEGAAYINNMGVSEGAEIPKSCVVTLGAPIAGPYRTFVAIDTSHPGVVL